MTVRKAVKFALTAALVLSASGFALHACARGNLQSAEETPRESVNAPSEGPSEEPSADGSAERERRRISVVNGMFAVDGGTKPIWINGTNTPWNQWNDFGGGYDDGWWNGHFAALRANGVNAARVWINCNNDQNAVLIGADGMVSGVSEKHWADLDMFFAAAERNGVYIMATILSFDHFKNTGNRPSAENWRAMLKSEKATDSFIERYTLPFLSRYKDNPYLWSIDLMNEPDWVYEEEACGNVAWEDLSRFFARSAAAIRANSSVLVTVGMAFPKYNADGAGYQGNKVSDDFLQSLYADKNAALDFWSPHYYDWVGQWYGVPFTSSPSGPRAEGGWGLDGSKPAVLAECPANGSAGWTLKEDYINAFENGWQGVMPWTSNGVDGNGGFDELTPATRYMADTYPDLVFPFGREPANGGAASKPDISGLTSMELTGLMGAGWNLGNTLDAHWNGKPWGTITDPAEQEKLWGNPVTTKEMIDFVKASGFNTVRVPVTWYIFTGPGPEYKIDPKWMDRVQEVVDYAIGNGMFVILNIHHDDYRSGNGWDCGWLTLYGENGPLPASEKEAAKKRFAGLWKQIAGRFQDYDEYLLFEGINEPRTESLQKHTGETWAEQAAFLNELEQVFVDTVRAGGGKNPDRHLMITPYFASVGMDTGDGEGRIAGFVDLEKGKLWVDDPRGRLIASLHYYEPWGFVTAPGDSQWFSAVFDLNIGSVSWNVNQVFQIIETVFISNGIPVVMGETGAIHRETPGGGTNEAERVKWAEYYVAGLKKLGVPSVIWDDGGGFRLLDRNKVEWVYPDLAAAFVAASR